MKILFASDSFKGSLSSEDINGLLTEAAKKVFPDCQTEGVLIADGGEGTMDAVIAMTGGERKKVMVHGPRMELMEASYGIFDGDAAIIEMAAASGLPLVPAEERNPLYTTSYGTGELIRDALDSGYRKLSIAIGGSATNDGGMGAMRALGVRFLDEDGAELEGFGKDLEKVKKIDLTKLHPAAAEAEITVMCDVTNPLTGPDGATYTFGPQKGAVPEIADRLEAGMTQYAAVLLNELGIDAAKMPGAGAAGGMGAALCVFLGATLKSGIETVLDLIHFEERLEDTDLVITGEGRIDWQSAFGKVPSGIGKRCKEKQIPVAAIVGGMGKGAEKIYEFGVDSIISTINGAMEMDEAMKRAKELYADAAERTFRMIRIGMQLREEKEL